MARRTLRPRRAWRARSAPETYVGLEYYADFGEIGNFARLQDQQHTLFAVTDFKLGVFDVDFGVGYGLTPASDRWVVKTIIGYAFPVPGGNPGTGERSAAGPVNPMAHASARLPATLTQRCKCSCVRSPLPTSFQGIS